MNAEGALYGVAEGSDSKEKERVCWDLLRILSVLSVILATGLGAEGEDESLETMVVSASRLESSAGELTPSIEVISRDQIEGRNPTSVTELLRQVAGGNIIQQGGRGGVTSILLRGGEPNFTVVLIDGVKVNDPTNTRGGSYDFGNLEIGGIERIEVVRGPMSALYGSDAMAGVVNIVTRDDVTGAEIGIEVGSNGYASANASAGGALGNFSAGIKLNFLNDEGEVEGADYEGWGMTGRVTAGQSGATEVGLAFRYHHSESTAFPEDSGGPRLAVFREIDRRKAEEAHIRVSLDHAIASGWKFSVAGSVYQRNKTTGSPGIAPGVFNGVPPNSTDTEFSRRQIVSSIRSDGNTGLSLLAGVEWQEEIGESRGVLLIGFPLSSDFNLERDTVSAFSEIRIKRGPILLQGVVRWDDPNGIGGKATGRIGALYRFSDGLTEIRANWGQGFKAPSFFALAHPLVGNPDLLSETASSVDFNLKRRIGDSKGELGMSVFRNKYEDLVDFDAELFRSVNRSKVVTQGAEFAIDLPLNDYLNLRGHLTYLETEVTDSDAQLRGRPEWRGGAVIDWEIHPRWRLATSILVLDRFYESSIPTGGMFLGGYVRIDTALNFEIRDNFRVRFAVDNLLDQEYEEAVGFPASGIRGRIGVSFGF